VARLRNRRFDIADPAGIDAWIDVSRRFAEGASGTARVVLGATRSGSAWEVVQFPALVGNRHIDRVIAIDADSGDESIIYERRARKLRASTSIETDLTRSTIWVAVDGRTAVVSGEAFLPGYGSPDFLASVREIEWEDGTSPSADELAHVVQVTQTGAAERGLTIELD
jgi:hypothetical protein